MSYLVGVVEAAIDKDVALATVQQTEVGIGVSPLLVQSPDRLRLTGYVRRGDPNLPTADVQHLGVVGDAEVLPAQLHRCVGHLFERRGAVRGHCVVV